MSVKINGAVYRNIPGEAEGIDTPSLKINGAPLSGGTKLYKHSLFIGGNYIKIISTRAAKCTNATDIFDCVDKSMSSCYNCGSSGYVAVPNTDDEEFVLITFNLQVTGTIAFTEAVTDTVVAL